MLSLFSVLVQNIKVMKRYNIITSYNKITTFVANRFSNMKKYINSYDIHVIFLLLKQNLNLNNPKITSTMVLIKNYSNHSAAHIHAIVKNPAL